MNPIAGIIKDQQTARSLDDQNANICFLALSGEGAPSVRTLVLRDISEAGFTLFINKTSPKWRIITGNNRAELLLWYASIRRQYRVGGLIDALDQNIIEEHWPRKPAGSKYLDHAYETLGPQSSEIASRDLLLGHIDALAKETDDGSLAVPAAAGGIILRPAVIECLDLNQGGSAHDRRHYEKADNKWIETVLIP